MKLLYIASALVLLAAPSAALADTTLYTQASNNSDAYYSGTNDLKVSDNFTLSSTGTISQVTFEGGYFAGVPASDTFTINFFADASGVPGTLLSSSASTPSITDTGDNDLGTEYYSFTAAVPSFTATGGTQYWLQIFSMTTQNFAWRTGAGGDGSHFEDGTVYGAGTFTETNDMAFTLTNASAVATTPEPSSLALLGTGVMGVVGMARRRFRRA